MQENGFGLLQVLRPEGYIRRLVWGVGRWNQRWVAILQNLMSSSFLRVRVLPWPLHIDEANEYIITRVQSEGLSNICVRTPYRSAGKWVWDCCKSSGLKVILEGLSGGWVGGIKGGWPYYKI